MSFVDVIDGIKIYNGNHWLRFVKDRQLLRILPYDVFISETSAGNS